MQDRLLREPVFALLDPWVGGEKIGGDVDDLTEQELQDVTLLRQLGDGKAEAAIEQCKVMARYFGNGKSLSRMAAALEASKPWMIKLSGAGAVLETEAMGEEYPIELLYQVSLWPGEEWEEVADLVDLAGLNATELRTIRIVSEKLRRHGTEYVLG